MDLLLERFAYTPTETQGRLTCPAVPDILFWTIERPWINNPLGPGGMPFQSCVPDGKYTLVSYQRSDGSYCHALKNPQLGVYVYPPDGVGRYAVLIHAGNTVDDVVGCIAPGSTRTIHENQVFVGNSRKSLEHLHRLADPLDSNIHTLDIRPFTGTE